MLGFHREPPATCGDYLDEQRRKLAQIQNLETREGKRAAAKYLSNIYAVSYQMNFERPVPPSHQRIGAEEDRLDRKALHENARQMRQSIAFRHIIDDPELLADAVVRAGKGNGFPLFQAIQNAHRARTDAP